MANVETITANIEKANEFIAKKQNTIAKKQNTIAKKKVQVSGLTDEREIYWMNCDIKDLEEDIISLGKQIVAKQNTIAKYEAQLERAIQVDSLYITKVPEVMKQMEAELVETWDAYDAKDKTRKLAELKEVGYKAFVDKYSYAVYERLDLSAEQMHNQNVKDARVLVLDLYQRIYAITGEVTSWNDIYAEVGTHGFTVLNGRVNGTDGAVRVESILAGGYNIQRLHVRVLVHQI